MPHFDTLAFAKRLRASGVSEAQAEAMAEAQGEAFREMLDSTLATKADIAELKREIAGGRAETGELRFATGAEFKSVRAEIGELRFANQAEFAGVRGEIAQLRSEMYRVVAVQTLALAGAIFAAAAFF